ncbi:cysteine-rich motor neuron 1 protein-like [Gigantopelta aegis]|uniref:cysteine-rich motor neuron 1 protein-like n=1 Tax=Gigantopelta aegis TaxID=1735272 RepID=UPI001B88C53B|nr:cysteine-rich motor neuron 1 protein-like [Gigantopelta aegis]
MAILLLSFLGLLAVAVARPNQCPPVPFYRPIDCAAMLVINECSVKLQNCPAGKTCCPGICGSRTCQLIGIKPPCPCGPKCCRRYCPNGYAMDANGCEICRCKVVY